MTTRRAEFLAGTTALVAFVTAGGVQTAAMAADAPEHLTTLGSWLRMMPDGTVDVFSDKVEVGMGVQTGLAQFVADELDIPFNHVKMILGDTALVPNQGGVGGSTTTFMGNFPIRHVAAQMRSILVDAASQKLGVPAKELTVTNGVVWVTKDPARGVAYRDLIAALYPDPTFPLTGEGSATDVKVPHSRKRGRSTRLPVRLSRASTRPRKRSDAIHTSSTTSCPGCSTGGWSIRPGSVARSLRSRTARSVGSAMHASCASVTSSASSPRASGTRSRRRGRSR
jgi:CO/xanthine dehydrogenase Mo-binding subunit